MGIQKGLGAQARRAFLVVPWNGSFELLPELVEDECSVFVDVGSLSPVPEKISCERCSFIDLARRRQVGIELRKLFLFV